jgi:hypothetical protein
MRVFRLFDLLLSPREVSRQLDGKDTAILAVLAIVGYATATALLQPFVFPFLSSEEVPGGTRLLARLTLVLVPALTALVALTVKWLFLAYPIWAFAGAWGSPRPFPAALTVAVSAELPRVVGRFFSVALVYLRPGGAQSMQDLTPPIGLNLCCRDLSPGWDAALNQVNMFEIWSIVILTAAVGSRFELSTRRAALLATVLWLAVQVVQLSLGFSARVRVG